MPDWVVHERGVIGTSPIVLPHRCITCGRPTEDGGVRYRTILHWYPGWIWIGIFWGILPYVLLYYASRRPVKVDYSLCSDHVRSGRTKKYVTLGLALAFLVALAATIATRFWPVGAWVSLVLFLAAVAGWFVCGPPLRAADHDDGVFAVRGFGREFLSELGGPGARYRNVTSTRQA